MPPTGPLIGSGTKAAIVTAAVAADMEHRDFIDMNDGTFLQTWTDGGSQPDIYKIIVSDGSVSVEKIASGYITGNGEAPTEADFAHLQADVFDYWRDAIDAVFTDWEDLPESANLGYDLAWVMGGASEIQLEAQTDGDDGGYADGNARLSGDIDNLFTRTADLSGDYAYAFNTTYVNRVRPNINALHALTMVLAYTIGGEQELLHQSRQQVIDTCTAAEAAFKASGPKGGDDSGAVVALIVIGAVAAGVAAVASGGASIPGTVAVAAGLVSAGASGASDLIGALGQAPAAAPEIPLGGSHPDQVLTNLREALRDIDTEIRREERLLRDLCSTTLGESQGVGSFNIDAVPVQGEILGAEQDTNVDDKVIADITELWIPTINGDLRACANRLTVGDFAWTKPASIGLGATGPFGAYESLQTQVVQLLNNTADELSEAATALKEAARIIGLSDEQSNAASAALAERINRDNINA